MLTLNLYCYACIVVIILIMIYIKYKKENFDDKVGTEADEIYTSGATMRVLGQEFSSSDQGNNKREYNVLSDIEQPVDVHKLHKMQIDKLGQEMMTNKPFGRYIINDQEYFCHNGKCYHKSIIISDGSLKPDLDYINKKENLVNQSQAPDFWELNPILGKFKEEIMRV